MEPLTFVLFGSTGDLAQRKIMPALFELYLKGGFQSGSQIIAVSRRDWNDQDYRDFIAPNVSTKDKEKLKDFLSLIQYVSGTFDAPEGYIKLKECILNEHTVIHLAIKPNAHTEVIQGLEKAGIKGKLLIEKPFGHDLISAQKLEEELEKYVECKNIYRIDHYLGKRGLDEVLRKRKEDSDFLLRLNKEHLDSVHFRLIESLDIEGRGEFYDSVGAMLDVGQNHVLSMVSSFFIDISAAKNICGARAEVLKHIHILSTRRGQYSGYVDEKNVDANSHTETYFKVELKYENKKWNGVRVILEGGKALSEKRSDIILKFKDGSEYIFNIEQPKKPDAYEVVLDAAIQGDDSRFVCTDEMMESWRLTDEIKTKMKGVDLKVYEKGWDTK